MESNTIDLIVAVGSAYGGLELVKFVYAKIANRHNERLKEDAEAKEEVINAEKTKLEAVGQSIDLYERLQDLLGKQTEQLQHGIGNHQEEHSDLKRIMRESAKKTDEINKKLCIIDGYFKKEIKKINVNCKKMHPQAISVK